MFQHSFLTFQISDIKCVWPEIFTINFYMKIIIFGYNNYDLQKFQYNAYKYTTDVYI